MKKYYTLRDHQAFNRNSTAFYNLIKLIGKNFAHASKKNELNAGLKLIKRKLASKRISTSEIRYLIQAKKFLWMPIVDSNIDILNEPDWVDADITSSLKVYKFSENSDLILSVIIDYMAELNSTMSNEDVEKLFVSQLNVGSCDSYWREMLISYLKEKLDRIKHGKRGSSLRKINLLIEKIERLDKRC